jgi:hypothetical protein
VAILDRQVGRFFLGVILGMIAGLSVSLGILFVVAALALIVALGLSAPRYAFLAGGLIGLGGEWLVLSLNSALSCSRTEDFCGQANFVPLTVAAIAILGAGLTFGALTLRSRARGTP